MLALIRSQQKWIMIVVATVIIIAFAWFYNKVDVGGPQVPGGNEVAFTVYDQPVRIHEAERLARSYQILGYLGLSQFADALRGERLDSDLTDFAINLTVLREEARRMGIQPSREDITREIRNLPAFNPNGAYDASRYQAFLGNILTPSGFTHGDLERLIGDSLTFEKLQELFGASVLASPQEVDEVFEARYSKYTASRINIPPDPAAAPSKVSEAEIAEYYEKNKDSFQTEPQRRIAYVHFPKPVFDDPLEDKATPKSEAEAGSEKDAQDENPDAEADQDGAKEDAKPELTPEERKERELAVARKVNDFAMLLADGKTLEEAAQAQEVDLVRTEPFGAATIPDELKDAIRLQREVFKATLAKPLSDPVSTGDGFYVFKLIEVIEPKAKELSAARDEIRERIVETKTAEAVEQRADDIKTKLTASLEGGKTLSAAVKELGLQAKPLPPFSLGEPPRDEPQVYDLISAIADLEPGEIGVAVPSDAGAFLVHLEDRTLPEDEQADEERKNLSGALAGNDAMGLFVTWFQERVRTAARRSVNPVPSGQG